MFYQAAASFIQSAIVREIRKRQKNLLLRSRLQVTGSPLFFFQMAGVVMRRYSRKHYCRLIPVPYSGRGCPCNPIRQVDSQLQYAQVIKHGSNNAHGIISSNKIYKRCQKKSALKSVSPIIHHIHQRINR